MQHVTSLRCRECGRDHPVEPAHICEDCFGPLEVVYDYDAIAARLSPAAVASGPPTMWRYAPLLPAPERGRVDLGAGMTPLRPAPRLAAVLGLRRLWLKLDAANPTHSFKDRVVSVALSAARAFGFEVAACASTGNLANAVAAHAAVAGMGSVVLVPEGLESGKIAATAVYGGRLIAVRGSYDDVNRLCIELASERDWAFVNVNLRPYYAEGSRTLAFEIAEQLGWRAPDAVVAPMASGSMLTKVAKGFRDLHRVGLLADEPRVTMYGAQAAGCAPIAGAFVEGRDEITPVRPSTVARSLAIGNPADGYYALREVRAGGGAMAVVPEDEVAEGIRLLARTEGLFTETAGGVTVAGLRALVRDGALAPERETVALLTGTGLKTLEALAPARPTGVVAPSIDRVEALLSEEVGR